MEKISVEVLEKMMKKRLTKREVDFVLYVGRFQNEYGMAHGIYYRDLCKEVGLSFQGFYDCMRALQRKGIIAFEKRTYFDYDIEILDNSFAENENSFAENENYGRGYVSLHNKMVRSAEFKKLKAPAKLMALYLMREWQINKKKSRKPSYQMLVETFNQKFKELLGLSHRAARRYLGSLEPFLSIYMEDNRKYFFTFKAEMVDTAEVQTGENDELREHEINIAMRRNRIKEETEERIREMHTILQQHNKEIKKDKGFSLSRIVKDSLEYLNEGIKNRYKWKRYLSPGIVHKLVIETL